MADEKELLSQDEIDALLHGVDSDEIDIGGIDADEDGVSTFDLAAQDRIVRGRMPTLDMINERFVRTLKVSMFNKLRRTAEVTVKGVSMMKFSEYIHSMQVPTSLNVVKVRPFRGVGLFVLDSKLVYNLVESFFGGNGQFKIRMESKDFTEMESRIIGMLMDLVYIDLQEAWKPVQPLEFEFTLAEVNPHMANVMRPTEVVVVNEYKISLEGNENSEGELHFATPYSMLEPIKELLEAGVQSDQDERDERWAGALREEVFDARVDISSFLAHAELSLREIMNMNVGDVFPVDLSDHVTVLASEIPTYRAKYGISNGQSALKIIDRVKRE